jgi:hypothetical protein
VATPPRPGPGLRLSIAILVIGAVVTVPSAVAAFEPLVRTFVTAPAFDTPGAGRVHLGHGRWLVYERSGTTNAVGIPSNHGVDIDSRSVTVSGPDGPLPVADVGTLESITRNRRVYTAVAQFDAPDSATYTVEVRTPTSTQVIVARSLGDTFRRMAGWLALAGLGGLLFVIGLVMLIVGSVRRGRVNRFGGPPGGWPGAQPPWGQPPQWGPQPQWGPPPAGAPPAGGQWPAPGQWPPPGQWPAPGQAPPAGQWPPPGTPPG